MRSALLPTALCLLSFMLLASAGAEDGEYVLHEFEKLRLTEEYFAEGASFGDFDHDGQRDLVCGPNWFAGPDFKEQHRFYEGKAFPNDRGYSNNFFSLVGDFNGDDWDDVLVVGLPGTPAHWYENSRGDEPWKKHLAFPAVDNEAPLLEDVTGDDKPELVCTFEGRLGYAAPDANAPTRPWHWHPVSEKGGWHRYSHGLGVGDVNGDGRTDFLTPIGWWEQPASPADQPIWKHHPFKFCGGGAQMYAYDVDGDGDNDVVTSLQAHAWGLSWFEHVKGDDGQITFEEHKIMGAKHADSPFCVRFSQLHAVDCIDVDGDGLRDIVAGKCYWAHNGHDPGAREPAVVYYFRLVRKDGQAEFVPHLVDDDSGVGRQVRAADMNGDGLVDIIAGNKKGTFVFLHKTRKVDKQEWEQRQPKRIAAAASAKTEPDPEPAPDASPRDVKITPDVVYGHKLGLAMTFDVFQPEQDAKGVGVLFMVSGGWYSRWAPPEQTLQMLRPLTDQGFTVFAVRHGSSPKFSIPEAVEDVRRSVRFIRLNAERFAVDPERLGVFGMSAGGHLSLMLGTASDQGDPQAKDEVLRQSNRVQAVVAFVAPTDLRGMVWSAPDHLPAYDRFPALDLEIDKAAEVSPLLHVSSDDPPTLLLVGAKDKLVPMKHSQDIHEALQDKNVTSKLVVYEDSAHGLTPPDLVAAVAELVAWFDEHLAEE